MTTVGTYRCPEPSCLRPLVKRRTDGVVRLWCQACRSGYDVPERKRMLAQGEPQLPGFETEGR